MKRRSSSIRILFASFGVLLFLFVIQESNAVGRKVDCGSHPFWALIKNKFNGVSPLSKSPNLIHMMSSGAFNKDEMTTVMQFHEDCLLSSEGIRYKRFYEQRLKPITNVDLLMMAKQYWDNVMRQAKAAISEDQEDEDWNRFLKE